MKQIENQKVLTAISLTGSIFIIAQLAFLTIRGEALCLNDGCSVVENLIKVSPLLFNLLGLFYFLVLFWLLRPARATSAKAALWISLILLAGCGVEGVLLAFQFFVAKALCSYCLIIFALIMAMNLLFGYRQLLRAGAIMLAVLFISSLLNYEVINTGKDQSLLAGTYATLQAPKAAKKLFLILSENCPHCHNVIKALERDNICTVRFNPIEPIISLEPANLKISESFSPEKNKNFLALMGIKTIPVLVVENIEGFSIIKGEQNIIKYLDDNCSDISTKVSPVTLPAIPNESVLDSLIFQNPNADECSVEVDCDDEPQKR